MLPTFVYHQSHALLKNISKYIFDSKAASLLDIGAGGGTLALPLSKTVTRYLAVEENSERCAKLRMAGLDALMEHFPTPIGETFDFVLSSHSIPEQINAYPAFLSSAWQLTKPGGQFVIVTYKGRRGAIFDLRQELLGGDPDSSPEMDCIEHAFRGWGTVSIEKFNSYAEAQSAIEIVTYFEEWMSGREEIKQRIRQQFLDIVEARFCVRPGCYVFPTEHAVARCFKKSP